MILIAHLLFGAVIGHLVKNPALALILAFFSHYFLDLLPHTEYPIENIQNNQWHKALPDFAKVFIDFTAGILLIFFAAGWQAIIFACAIAAIIPDGLTILDTIVSHRALKKHAELHSDKIHFLRDKKISFFWRVASQLAIVAISIMLLELWA